MKVYSIFPSIDGEVNKWGQGVLTTFVRMAGCNLRCIYCDTKYAQNICAENDISVLKVLENIESVGCKKVTITGGEPTLQFDELTNLINKLCDLKYNISVETNGTSKITSTSDNVCWIVDYKLPSSGMERFMEINNFLSLKESDFVKFVIGSEQEFFYALDIVSKLKSLNCLAKIAFGVLYNEFSTKQMIDLLITNKKYDIIINTQLHKYIWSDLKYGEEK